MAFDIESLCRSYVEYVESPGSISFPYFKPIAGTSLKDEAAFEGTITDVKINGETIKLAKIKPETFNKGDKVQCVDDSNKWAVEDGLRKGNLYTVESWEKHRNLTPCLRMKGHDYFIPVECFKIFKEAGKLELELQSGCATDEKLLEMVNAEFVPMAGFEDATKYEAIQFASVRDLEDKTLDKILDEAEKASRDHHTQGYIAFCNEVVKVIGNYLNRSVEPDTFEVGDKVRCVTNEEAGYVEKEGLTIGDSYTVEQKHADGDVAIDHTHNFWIKGKCFELAAKKPVFTNTCHSSSDVRTIVKRLGAGELPAYGTMKGFLGLKQDLAPVDELGTEYITDLREECLGRVEKRSASPLHIDLMQFIADMCEFHLT